MARREESFSALAGLLLGLVIIVVIVYVPQNAIYSFLMRPFRAGGYSPPVSRWHIARLSLLVLTVALWFTGVCTYFLIRGISLLLCLRRTDGFTWSAMVVAAIFFIEFFLKIASGWWSIPLAVLPLFTFLVLLCFQRLGMIAAAIFFIVFFLGGPVGWCGRPLGVLLLFIFLALIFSRRLGFIELFFNFVGKKRVSLILILVISTALFFKMFPLGSFNDYIFQDDYGVFLYKTRLELGCLKEGYLYGWDGDFLGGYPSFLNLRSVAFLFLPLRLFFPEEVAFHLFILGSFLAFPLLVYLASRRLLGEEKEALFSAWCAVGLLCGYRANILGYGMIPSFVSVNLFLLSFILFSGLLKGQPLTGFFLALVLSLSFFVHFGHFVHTVWFLGIIYIFLRSIGYKVDGLTWRKGLLIFVAFLFIVSPFLTLLVRFQGHLVSTRYWASLPGGFSNLMGYLKKTLWDARPSFFFWANGRFGFQVRRFHPVAVLLLPVAFYNLKFRKEKAFLPTLLLFASIFFVLLAFIPSVELLMERLNFLAPPILALFMGCWLYQAHKRKAFYVHFLVIVLSLFLFISLFMTMEPIDHIRNLSDFNPNLVDKIKHLDGHIVLFENYSGGSPMWDRSRNFERAPRPHVHVASYAQRYAKKRFLAHPGFDPHPYHKIRNLYIVNGTYLGKSLEDFPQGEFNALLKKWGVKYLVVWSDTASDYFYQQHRTFKKIYEDDQFYIYQFLQADPRSVVTENGQGQIVKEDHFNIWLGLRALKEGERVILRYNYFPLWRAFWQNGEKRREIELVDYQGQISFISPAPGDYTVQLVFPKEWWWAVLSLAGLGALFVLSLKRWV